VSTGHGSRRAVYDLLTGKIAPYATDGDSIQFDKIVNAPVDDETVGLVAECLVDTDAETRRAGLFVLAGLQDDSKERLDPFRPLVPRIRQLLLDNEAPVRCDALMAYAYFDPKDLGAAVHEFLGDPSGRNRLQAVRILDAERNPSNVPTLLTLSLDTYHEEERDAREWLVVREAAREAVEHVAHRSFPAPLDEEEIEGVACLYHLWDPLWQWAAKAGIRGNA
jgi:HEAT repeat protein